VTTNEQPCHGCEEVERLGRRRFMRLLATGAALALAGCSSAVRSATRRRPVSPTLPPVASSAPIVQEAAAGPPLQLGIIPPPHPGPVKVISTAPLLTRRIALTIDDGYCGDCIARYVDFAQKSGIHITFNPNGAFRQLWTPSIVESVRAMVALGQVQIGNHTWSHPDLRTLSSGAIASELSKNEDWIQQTFGVTARPYFRPPYGNYNATVQSVAGGLGYTTLLMWNGTFGDATLETPTELISLAEKWLQPGTIMLGHLNHPTVLDLFDRIEKLIADRNLEPVTVDEMFGTSRVTG
jgi:peptidoglycan/xylan/chitin deacetylase (PgdA/CDA1 family)